MLEKKGLTANNRMAFQVQICVLIYASENKTTFQRHCFIFFQKENLRHTITSCMLGTEKIIRYLLLQYNYN